MTASADADADADLQTLADACGVATTYDDYRFRPVRVGAESVRLALEAMGVAAGDRDAVRSSIDRLRREAAQRLAPPSVVVRTDRGATVALREQPTTAELVGEDGRSLPSRISGASVLLPANLPTGYSRLRVEAGGVTATASVVVAPARCPLPSTPGWGWMVQLYQARSRRSWGMGDYGDLAALGAWTGGLGGAFLLVNPLHAASPVVPQTDSPYFPSSRRYRSPLYLRIEDVAELAGAEPSERERVGALAETARRACAADRIDRDAVFRAKTAALELLSRLPRSDRQRAKLAAWRRAEGPGIEDFATYCALAERHGASWQAWPEPLRHPASPAVAAARDELAERVELHVWLQWLCDRQLADAQRDAAAAGMPVGVVHDLAVGVDPGGADAWALQEDLAPAMTVGAPPDGFNQKGQDWGLPPLIPQRLAETGYAPFRDMLRSVLRHAGGIRIDHVMGLWRLWWVPQGRPASEGTYVRYPADALLGILALEAERAGAVVVGEDLGTVEEGVRDTLAERGILSSRVLYFEHVDDDPEQPLRPSQDYPRLALSSVTTHDLPTAAGWWADEDVRTQTELGLFSDSTTGEAEAARKAAERKQMLALLRREGVVSAGPVSDDDLVAAMHAFLARTPSLLVATGLGDALGDRRQPNMPGTVDEYPSWRMPLARWTDAGPAPVTLDDIVEDPRVLRVAALLARRRDHR